MNIEESSTLAADDAGQDADDAPPIREQEEWANALTHGIGMIAAVVSGIWMSSVASERSTGLAIAILAYAMAVAGTFLCSTLSHSIFVQPWLNRFRAWDQAMIYLMITGTYTPIVYACASDTVRGPLLIAIWVAAIAGFVSKVTLKHRINSSGTVSYLLLGWLPVIPLVGSVPFGLGMSMLAGGVLYTLGVLLLINDHRVRYLHAGWHLFVIAAAATHFAGIYVYLVR